MRLTLLGTGCPVVDEGRYGSAHLVRTEATSLLIDCGSGVTQRLLSAGTSRRDIDALLLTHLHSDHVIDLYQFVISSWHQGRAKPHRIFGPPGTRRYVETLMALWETERTQRIEHEKRPSTAAFDLEIEEISSGDVIPFDGVAVSVVEVDHRPVRHAFGFVFETAAARMVFSGDTAPCQLLAEAAAGADLLLHEVFMHREMPVTAGLRTMEGIRNVAGYHTASSDIGRIARTADVGLLVLTHFVPPKFDKDALLDEIADDFTGPVVIGEDGMTFDVAKRRLSSEGAVVSLGAVSRTEE